MNRFSIHIIALVFLMQFLAACGSGSADLEGPGVSASGSGNDPGTTGTTNVLPTANAGSNQTVAELEITGAFIASTTVFFTGSGTDTDGTVSDYSWEQISGVSVSIDNPTSRNASFLVPEVNETEVLIFELTVTDNDGGSASDRMQVTVNPHITVANAGTAQTVQELDRFTLNPIVVRLSGSSTADPEGNLASYQWEQVLATGDVEVTLNNASTSKPSFNTPDVREETELTFKLTVTDHEDDIDTDTVVITIENHEVRANAGEDQTVDELDADTLMPTEVTLTGSSDTDIDGNVATFSWTQVAGPDVTLTGAETATPSFVVPEINNQTVFSFTLTATERVTNKGNDTVNITVNSHVVVANAGIDRTVEEDTQVTLSGSSAADESSTIATYEWTQLLAPGGVDVVLTVSAVNPNEVTFTTPILAIAGTPIELEFELTVTDNEGDTGTDIVVIEVIEANSPPVAEAGIYQYVVGGNIVTLNGTFSKDLETSNVTLLWDLINDGGFAVPPTLNNNTLPNPTFSAPDEGVAGTLIYKLQVFDDQGVELATDKVHIAVRPTSFDNSNDTDGNGALSYTKINKDGKPLPLDAEIGSHTSLLADAAADKEKYYCILDNVNGLVWEAKLGDAGLHSSLNIYSWYQPTIDINGDDEVNCDDIVNGSICAIDGTVGTEGEVSIWDPEGVWITSKEQDAADPFPSCTGTDSCDTQSYTVAKNLDGPTRLCENHNRDYVWGDWRLPDRLPTNELATLIDSSIVPAENVPLIDKTFFQFAEDDAFWTSDTFDSDREQAWVVYFGDGDLNQTWLKINYSGETNSPTSLPVRLVREVTW